MTGRKDKVMENNRYFINSSCAYTLWVYLSHPEYGNEVDHVVLVVDWNEDIDWNKVVCDLWEQLNPSNIYFDIKVTAEWAILVDGQWHGATKNVYQGGDPHYEGLGEWDFKE